MNGDISANYVHGALATYLVLAAKVHSYWDLMHPEI